MTDIEVALELTKLVQAHNQMAYNTPDQILELFRKCLAAVRERQE
jgi:hypothetical protein